MNECITLLKLLFEHSVLANFEYWGEFILRIQRDEATKPQALHDWFGDARIPSLFCLRLRGKWKMGEQAEWERSLRHFPMKGTSPIPVEAPLQASILMTMLDKVISTVVVGEDGAVTLTFLNGQTLTVEGINEESEESWFLELPIDDPDLTRWSMVCDSLGHVSGEYPNGQVA